MQPLILIYWTTVGNGLFQTSTEIPDLFLESNVQIYSRSEIAKNAADEALAYAICLSACSVQSTNIVQLKFATELALFICD
ncbi:hypothetical protein T11_16730 [Trichinella zimbabwensis]|uniref:Uncharacterized protein n=1 Tax=Trichinella zimbabwensis TaxID=268475 RepID=A0A0V1I660_9BILA|nr:hypothetical protein T11_18339 [Trichinella zimbabwensis]KRZ18347.1 hypothetical protein T11_16730 [Trichinella zimbabwensis]